ncbi:hypothetical protein L7F22_011075 [Adiantum nelumboides]|nr:hypothetical protein [Adiantum nelumboides]
MKLCRNRSSIHQESNQERVSDGSIRSSTGLFRLILHSLLCIAALVLGFRLSGETRLVAVSIKPAHGTFLSSSIARFYQARSFGAWPGSPYVIDDRRNFTPVVSESPPSAKSSRVHVGRHEILIRPWPHPNPVQTLTAHGLIEQIQHEQQRLYGLQERKQVIVVTSTYVRAFQAVYLSCLIHTLRIVPGPLVWIVVEAGGVSNETTEMLSQSRLSYYHLAIQEPMPADLRGKEQLEIHLKLEGLRFIRNHRLDGVVIFLDESNTFDLDLFDAAQKIAWFGTFLVGLLQHSELPAFSQENVELAGNFSIASVVGKFKNTVGSSGTSKESNTFRDNRHSIFVKKDPISGLSLPLDGPVCSPEGHMAGWYVSNPKKSHKWAAFALNTRMFWEDVSKPSWIKSWGELFCENSSLPESPLAFLRNYSYIEPLGDCGRSIMMWSMGVDSVEASVGSNFPSKWIISPPLEVVVPSRQTPWSAKPVEKSDFDSYTPPPYVHLTSETIMERGKGRIQHATEDSQAYAGNHGKRVNKEPPWGRSGRWFRQQSNSLCSQMGSGSLLALVAKVQSFRRSPSHGLQQAGVSMQSMAQRGAAPSADDQAHVGSFHAELAQRVAQLQLQGGSAHLNWLLDACACTLSTHASFASTLMPSSSAAAPALNERADEVLSMLDACTSLKQVADHVDRQLDLLQAALLSARQGYYKMGARRLAAARRLQTCLHDLEAMISSNSTQYRPRAQAQAALLLAAKRVAASHHGAAPPLSEALDGTLLISILALASAFATFAAPSTRHPRLAPSTAPASASPLTLLARAAATHPPRGLRPSASFSVTSSRSTWVLPFWSFKACTAPPHPSTSPSPAIIKMKMAES